MKRRGFFKGLGAGIAGIFALPNIFVPTFAKGIWKPKGIIPVDSLGYPLSDETWFDFKTNIMWNHNVTTWCPLQPALDYSNRELPLPFQKYLPASPEPLRQESEGVLC